VNVSPAIALFGDAKTKNAQGNGNTANATVTQSNDATQSQSATQKQYATQEGGCCTPAPHECKPAADPCKPHEGYDKQPKEGCCEHGSSQTGEQKASFGDQSVGEQRNEASVTQKQGNGNLNVSPAIGLGGGKKHESCYSKCGSSWKPLGGNAETTNYQGNGNEANANVGQSNSVDQSQTSYQRQSLVDMCKGLVYR
jgi:hypothetical protein